MPPPHAHHQHPAILRYGVALAASVAALWLRTLLAPSLGATAPLLLLVWPIAISAWFGGTGPGVMATLLCGSIGSYLFLPGHGPLVHPTRLEWTRLLLFLAQGISISWVLGVWTINSAPPIDPPPPSASSPDVPQ